MTETLVHYSAEPLTKLNSVDAGTRRHYAKPNGLWISVEGNDDGWREWCESEKFGLENFAHAQRIHLAANANVLRVSDPSGLVSFHYRYRKSNLRRDTYDVIDWGVVGKDYQGIIIAPYIWAMRLSDEVPWYYTWDCASGCIWDARAVDQIEAIPQSPAELIGTGKER